MNKAFIKQFEEEVYQRMGQDVVTDVTWHGDRAAHFVSNSMSQGSCLIDGDGVIKLPCLES